MSVYVLGGKSVLVFSVTTFVFLAISCFSAFKDGSRGGGSDGVLRELMALACLFFVKNLTVSYIDSGIDSGIAGNFRDAGFDI